ncbi:glycoside hydrolase superfamily [Kockiozyma suomiensis]|uniref:glycoside hydrolase superfamily n=1 Tax=Kockiozyma suomiensis TaxID=1337062 RepID=UPI003342EA17
MTIAVQVPPPAGQLPADFLWGYATAAYQIEGSPEADGRGLSIWDTFSRDPAHTEDGKSGDIATDSYARYEEDIALMKSYGVTAYRFSLSWSRIIPLGGKNDPVNPAGIAYYRKFMKALIANGIEPMCTLFHWDLPQALQDRYTGFCSRDIIEDFVNYAKVCFDNFNDLVNLWITINEPNVYALMGHCLGTQAPGRSSDRKISPEGDSSLEPLIVGHNLLLSHGAIAKLYREGGYKLPGKKLGIVINVNWGEPYDDTEESLEAAADFMSVTSEWYAHPVYCGDYSERTKRVIGANLPKFTPEEIELVKDSSDFFGLNHYTTYLIRRPSSEISGSNMLMRFMGNVETTVTYPDGTEIGPKAGLSWVRPVPWGFKKLLKYLYKNYGKDIYITENGVICPNEGSLPYPEILEDDYRISYFRDYVDQIIALKDSVPVKAYIGWSFLDNFEWQEGYTARFGVTYVDYEDNLKRYPKKSAIYMTEYMGKAIAKA